MKIKGTQSNRFLANSSTQNNTPVSIYDYAADGAKDWKIEPVGSGYYRILHKKSGKSLDITNNSASQDANAVTKENNSNDGQVFKIEEVVCDNAMSLVATTNSDNVIAAETNTPVIGKTLASETAIVLDKTNTTTATYHAMATATVFPNPATTYFDMDLSFYTEKAVTVSIYNQFGALMMTHAIAVAGTEPAHIDISNLSNGNYMVRIASKGTTDLMKKIVIVK